MHQALGALHVVTSSRNAPRELCKVAIIIPILQTRSLGVKKIHLLICNHTVLPDSKACAAPSAALAL